MPAPSPQAWLFHAGATLPRGLGNEAGWSVFDLQTYLAGLSAARRLPRISPGPVTGVMNPATRTAILAWLVADGHGTVREFGDMEAARLLRAMTAARVTPIGDRWQPVPWSVSVAVWNAYLASKGGLAAAFRSRVQANAAPNRDAAYAVLRAPAAATTRPATTAAPTPQAVQATGSDQTYGKITASSAPLLRTGVCGQQVTLWQRFLRSTSVVPAGSRPGETGVFDAATTAATILVQRWIGASPDGAVGSDTRTKLRARLVAAGQRVTAATPYGAAPCPSSTTSAPAGGSSSSSGSASGGGDSLGGSAPSGGPIGGLLNVAGRYGPVLAVGLGVAAFAMIGGGGGGRRR